MQQQKYLTVKVYPSKYCLQKMGADAQFIKPKIKIIIADYMISKQK